VTSLRFGQAAPDFTLPSTGGGTVSLRDFRGRADVVLVFYCYDFGRI
jgi:peroxiredoxin Q/BCP